ncbi:MAG: peptide deformylase [Burkholderiales bacterium]|jgi:peptide deformylase|nr:peptide deformylase [Burkholderiales bacterium]
MIRDILLMGDPRLMRIAQPVIAFDTPDLRTLLQDMRDTMRALGGVGIAAPQIGVSLRIVIFGMDRSERYPDAPPVPYTEIVNPLITPLDAMTEETWEGCLSLPALRGVVPRFARIRYEGYDLAGNRIERLAEGFHARVVQHECDHLDGVLYPMRMRDMSRFGYESALFSETVD